MKKIAILMILAVSLSSCKKEKTWQCTTIVHNFNGTTTILTTTIKGTEDDKNKWLQMSNSVSPNRHSECQ